MVGQNHNFGETSCLAGEVPIKKAMISSGKHTKSY
jgi:hypothetical protein